MQLVGRKSLSTTDSTDNETDRSSANKRTTGYYANVSRTRQPNDSTTITIQSSESSLEFERPVDEQQVNRFNSKLDSIRELARNSGDQLRESRQAPGGQPTSQFKIYQSATMYNLSSASDEPTELLIGDLGALSEQRPIRRHQSAEQMLKRIIRSMHDYYRKQFKS